MTPKYLNNPCKYDIHHSPMLRPLLNLMQILYRPLKGDASRIIKYNNLLKLDKIGHTQATITINGNPK